MQYNEGNFRTATPSRLVDRDHGALRDHEPGVLMCGQNDPGVDPPPLDERGDDDDGRPLFGALFGEGIVLSLEHAFAEIDVLEDTEPASGELRGEAVVEPSVDHEVLRTYSLDLTTEEIDDCIGSIHEPLAEWTDEPDKPR